MTSEKEIAEKVRERVLAEFDSLGIDDGALADMLDLFPEGVRRLKSRKKWTLETGLSVLDKLNIPVEVVFPAA